MKQSPTIPWRDKIKNKLIVSLSTVLILSLVLFGLICTFSFKNQVIQQIGSKNVQLATSIQEDAQSFLSVIMNDLSSLAGSLGEGGELISQQEMMDRYLHKIPDVHRLALLDNYGKEYLVVIKQPADLGGGRSANSQHGQNKVSFRENLFVSPVYPSYQAVPMVDISIPIGNFSDNNVSGTIKAGVSLSGLWSKISAIKLRPETTVYLIDKNGKLIAHSDIGLVSAAIDFSHIRKVRQFIFGAKESDLQIPLIYVGNKNTKVIGVAASIEKVKWGIVIEESVDSALASYRHTQGIVLFSLAGLIILAGITLGCCVTRLTRSIDAITRQAEALNGEEHAPMIQVDSKDEIAHLAGIINRMQKQLFEKNENLKRRYKELESIHDEFRESYEELEEVSEKLQASQSELNKQKEFEKQLIETANVLIVVLNRNGEVILSNKKCEEITGYSKNFILGKSWLQLMTPAEVREEYTSRFTASLSSKTPSSCECPIVTHDGAIRIISWHSTPVIDQTGNIIGIINVGEDITEEKNLQQELEAKNKALEEKNEELQNFVSIVSHDLKSPLYILQDFTAILLNDHKNEFGEDVIYYLERIRKNAENMEKLIIDILEFSKIGTTEGDYQSFPITQIVQRAVDELKPKIDEKNIRVTISSEFPTLLCDPGRILQVFTNLISNSVKFMNPDEAAPMIEIGCRAREGEYEFFVKDNGIGIEKEYHEKVFKIFQRLKELKHVEGTGVGLAIVKKIIENHGGKVWVDSAKGKGATFHFTLPASKPAPTGRKPLISCQNSE
ncbi:MAG: ATP-binding protein [bacterium]